jgi:hypothetical protein
MATDATKNPDRHRTRSGVLGRPNPELRANAIETLDARDWTMNEFIVAALEVLTRNPDPMLARLAKYRPERRKGRPPRQPT